MTTRARRIVAVAGVLALSGLAVAGLAPAGAQTAPPEVGWWTANQVAGVPIGRAALVPPGGSQVAAGSDGADTVAAVRFPSGPGGAHYEVGVQLGSDTDAATVFACPVIAPWTPVSGAPLSDAPAWDCSIAQSVGAVDADAGTISWQLSPDFVRDGAIDVVLIPPDAAESFTLTMPPPGEDSVTQSPAPPSPTTTAPATSPPPADASPPTTSTVAPASPRPVPPATAPTPVASPAAPPPTAPIGLPSPLPTTTMVPAELALADTPTPSSTSGRVLGGIVLAALLAGAALAARRAPTRAGGDEPVRRGVGRFVRPRDEPPVRI